MSGRFPDWWRQEKHIRRLVDENEKLKIFNTFLLILLVITTMALISK
jgi:hypothetical protein